MLLLLIIILMMVILLLMLKMMQLMLKMMLMLDPNDVDAEDEDWQVCEPKVFLGQMRSH